MLRLAVTVPRDQAARVLVELIGLSPGGVEEVDRGDSVEYAVYGPSGEIPSLPEIEAMVGGTTVSVSTTEVAEDWAERWRDFHRPLVIPGRLRVRASWDPAGSEDHDLVIDPGQAFGTGAHATTRLCLEQLLDLDPCGSLVDLGCGSGVLAILAARLGFAPVFALDNDPLAIEASKANIRTNRVDARAARCDLRTDPIPQSDILIANILAPALRVLARTMTGPKPREVILSGLLEEELDGMAETWREAGYAEIGRAVKDGWGSLRLT